MALSTLRSEEIEVSAKMRVPGSSPLCFGHLDRMLTEIGLWQHAAEDRPNPRHGYSIDDEARGLIVGLRHWQRGVETESNARLAATCFEFLRAAALSDGSGRYHNFCDAKGRWLDSVGSDDSFGRTLWGLGVACAADAPFAPRRDAELLLRRSLPAIDTLQPNYLRAQAFVMLGLAESRLDDKRLRHMADALADTYEQFAGDDWRWFEPQLTYCNARLPQALFAAAAVFPEQTRYAEIGTRSLDFLLQISHCDKGGYSPVGNARLSSDGWFKQSDPCPPLFDQQPVDAGALVECCVAAYKVTRARRFRTAARQAFGWYLGENIHGIPVYNAATGGVADALTRTGLNRNQGAESVLSYHLAYQALETLDEP